MSLWGCVCVQAVREFLAKVKQDLGLDVYSFSIFHVFFEQYLTIGHDALVLLTFATLAVTAVVYAFTASLWASALICIVLVMILVRMATCSHILFVTLFFQELTWKCMHCSYSPSEVDMDMDALQSQP